MNKGGQRSIPSNDQAFIRQIARRFQVALKQEPTPNPKELFVTLLDIITNDIGGMQYSNSDVEKAFERLSRLLLP